jgi:transposase
MPEENSRWQEIDEKLGPDDTARVVERQIDQLDREVIDALYRGVGHSAYDPLALLKMVVYQYLKGRQSPAVWYEEARLNEAMQWLGRGYQPARRTWYEFRDRIGGVVEQLHKQLVQHAIAQEHVDPTVGVQDGTSIAACASRHRMVNRQQLEKRQKLLTSVIEGSVEPDEELPKWVPASDGGRLDLARRMEIATEIIEERIAKNAAQPSDKRKNPETIQVSLSDPDAPLGRDKEKVYRPLYTVQFMVEPQTHLVLSYDCQAVTGDTGTLAPMIDKTQQIVGGRLRKVLGDGAYCSILDLRDAQERNIDLLAPVTPNGSTSKHTSASGEAQIPRDEFQYDAVSNTYTCPAGHQLPYKERERKQRFGGRTLEQYRYQASAEDCQGCPLASRCLGGANARTIRRMEGEELLEAQRAKMSRDDVKAQYALRGQTVERSFGDAKGNRRMSRYHGRGLPRAKTETGLLVLAQNLQILDRIQRNAANPGEITT